MKQVAKVLIIDNEDYHLLLERANHPDFFNDPDLPGGLVEEGEELLEAAIREVAEEVGIQLASGDLSHIYTGKEYSVTGTEYTLYLASIQARPPVTISWEHASFAWISREELLEQIYGARDTYMHMVHAMIKDGPEAKA